MSATYCKFLLRPHDDVERKKFFEFRNEDVVQMFQVLCILATFETIINLMELLYTFQTGEDQMGKIIQLTY